MKLTDVFNKIKERNLSYKVYYQISLRDGREFIQSTNRLDKTQARQLVAKAERLIKEHLYDAKYIFVDVASGYGPHTKVYIDLDLKPNNWIGWSIK